MATEELERWLTEELERLRERAPHAVLRLVRLTQRVNERDAEIGWMVELDTPNGTPPLDGDGLETVLGDMRLLGLQPTVLRALQVGPG